MLIKNALLFTAENKFEKLDISFNHRIFNIGSIAEPGDIDAKGYYIIPGLIDLHTHGAAGYDFCDGSPEGLRLMSEYYARNGVTSFCATMMTLPEETLTTAVMCIASHKRNAQSARCVGIYLEGPFLSFAQLGAQAHENLHTPDIHMLHRLHKASGNRVKIVGIAPELPGAMDFIKEASQVCSVSLAHTGSDYVTAMNGYHCGATYTTHVFNGMNELLHRSPSVVGAAFDSGAYAELICDGIHIHPSVIRMAFRLFGCKLILISDSLRCAGMPDGNYDIGGQIFTLKGGEATLQDGTIAGSSIHLLKAVQNAISYGIKPEDAIAAATSTPAKAIDMNFMIGSLSVGNLADMLLLDSHFNLISTIINGKVIHNELSGL